MKVATSPSIVGSVEMFTEGFFPIKLSVCFFNLSIICSPFVSTKHFMIVVHSAITVANYVRAISLFINIIKKLFVFLGLLCSM